MTIASTLRPWEVEVEEGAVWRGASVRDGS